MEWATVIAAMVGAIASVSVQVLLSTAEPRAVRRITKLTEAIDGLPKSDPARPQLIEVRTIWARRLNHAVRRDNAASTAIFAITTTLLGLATLAVLGAYALGPLLEWDQGLRQRLISFSMVLVTVTYLGFGLLLIARPAGLRPFVRWLRAGGKRHPRRKVAATKERDATPTENPAHQG
ncbi:hypothetical protein [Microbacterium sp. 22296]|uniref:hypothetical protein n=1 Tax=Microbacterium sp. 22296 TaxID=3453903 RepID=UPI003F8710FA